jgi:hypothetical protein
MGTLIIVQSYACFYSRLTFLLNYIIFQAHPISDELVTKVLGDRVSVSPVVTIEPRHRKFHQAIAITIPLPPKSPLRGGKTKPGSGTPTLRLLCSITG